MCIFLLLQCKTRGQGLLDTPTHTGHAHVRRTEPPGDRERAAAQRRNSIRLVALRQRARRIRRLRLRLGQDRDRDTHKPRGRGESRPLHAPESVYHRHQDALK